LKAKTVETVAIAEEDLGIRLDKLLSQYYPEQSRSYFQFLIDEEKVLVNGRAVKKQYRPALGDQLTISFIEPTQISVSAESIPLDILYEDEDLLAINKPAGMVVHPAPGSPSGTVANALLYHCQQLEEEEFESLRPGIVHRLDKETSGVLIAAKHLRAHQKLIEKFSQREVEKTYLVICCGVPKEGVFSAPIKRHPIHRQQMTVSKEGKEAITHFKVLARRQGLSLVEVRLVTGRTHQIRVHLRHMNCPVLGDSLYGSASLNKKYGAHRQLLHSHHLKIKHPFSEGSLEASAPIPRDMQKFIDLIRQA
jgi:23S rRNA pseudouridine1911/1915/1917 synthase